MNPERPLTPALSPDGGEGDRSRGLFEVQRFNAGIFCRGILTLALSLGERVKLWHAFGRALVSGLIQCLEKSRLDDSHEFTVGKGRRAGALQNLAETARPVTAQVR